MAARVSGRFAPAPPPFVDLPALHRPQVVDAEGYELSDEQLAQLASAVADPDAPSGSVPIEVEAPVEVEDEPEDEAMEVDDEEGGEEQEQGEHDAEDGEGGEEGVEESASAPTLELDQPEPVEGKTPLLSLSDR